MTAEESPREVYWRALVDLAARDPRVVCVDTDMGGLERTFARAFPDRYLNVGIAEANMMGVAAGLAARGFVPYVHTMATFATTRAAEQLKLDVAAVGLPVRVVASHAGLSAAHFGTTHYALEDLAVVRAVGGLSAVVPADAAEIPAALSALHALPGPAYLRLGRQAVPGPHRGAHPFVLGEAVRLRDGDDVTIVACGPYPVLMALEAAAALAAEGIGARVLEIHTLVPFDSGAVLAAASQTAGIVTVEEHRAQGGLGDAVAEATGAVVPCPVVRVAVTGPVGTAVRGHRELLEEAGVSADAVRHAAGRVSALRKGQVMPSPSTGDRTRDHVASLFRRVLRTDAVGVDDDFFTLGGNSLLAIELLDAIEQDLGVQITAHTFYRNTTVAELARSVERARETVTSEG
ncbi:transketolase [Streptosporangium becharense]|uniref:Transketolase n=1 Tax=Streptosporangium becharense TaxID=1816182 RepID=A0A7W9MK18_9ACTN|nr:transketolase C-terminal domain-containing protein [Streptosporangium becharense]MBB2910410.1 transketolase [Streptosporangium becharense]MBB5823153.1 transketolase [Streptosporangium becharense]